MANSYFKKVPNFDYVSRIPGDQKISNYFNVKNLFKRGKLREDIFQDLTYFTKYQIVGDERPDNVAYKTYGDSSLDWIVLLSNNMINIQNEWPLTQASFDEVMLDKYGTYDNLYSGIHHYETKEIKKRDGKVVLEGGLKISPTWKTNGNFVEMITNQISVISSGDSINPSKTVTVFMIGGIPNLGVGDQITINNVTEPIYNGQYNITRILQSTNGLVEGFQYELDSVPTVAAPILSDPRKESVLFYVPETGTVTANSYYYEFWDENLGYTVHVPSSSFVISVTNYDYEIQIQENKRNIFLLKPEYVGLVLNDIDDIMPYKKGGVQYVNSTLKRGDNIKLYQ